MVVGLPARSLGVPVPSGGARTCTACHGPTRPGTTRCFCCATVATMLARASSASSASSVPRMRGTGAYQRYDDTMPPVVPIALYRLGDPLHLALRRYKHAPAVAARRHFVDVLTTFAYGFFRAHWGCIVATAGGLDSVVAVPSSTVPVLQRPARQLPALHPLCTVLDRVPALHVTGWVGMERGAGELGHLSPSADSFIPSAEVTGQRVLVVDDTWSTGARACSAAHALRQAGAIVGAIVVLGRAIDPDASPAVAAWWRATMAAAPAAPVWSAPCCLSLCRRRRS